MKPSDVFGISVRVFGLSIIIYGIWNFVFEVATAMGIREQAPGYGIAYFVSGFLFLILGLYLLRGSLSLLRYVYLEGKQGQSQSQITP
jgi:hypothetical protein